MTLRLRSPSVRGCPKKKAAELVPPVAESRTRYLYLQTLGRNDESHLIASQMIVSRMGRPTAISHM
jgi:hypothetical protein